jgi:hypothetical protein
MRAKGVFKHRLIIGIVRRRASESWSKKFPELIIQGLLQGSLSGNCIILASSIQPSPGASVPQSSAALAGN